MITQIASMLNKIEQKEEAGRTFSCVSMHGFLRLISTKFRDEEEVNQLHREESSRFDKLKREKEESIEGKD